MAGLTIHCFKFGIVSDIVTTYLALHFLAKKIPNSAILIFSIQPANIISYIKLRCYFRRYKTNSWLVSKTLADTF